MVKNMNSVEKLHWFNSLLSHIGCVALGKFPNLSGPQNPPSLYLQKARVGAIA